MIELTTKAENYAAEKTTEVMTMAIAQAYADGYHDGYKDCEEEIPVDLRDNKTEFVDLGLPSGTLWAKDYVKNNKGILYLPYQEAEKFQLPTEELWNELHETCMWKGYRIEGIFIDRFVCLGPNGNSIEFHTEGYKEYEVEKNPSHSDDVYFWINDSIAANEKNAVHISVESKSTQKEIIKIFSGYKLPIRLVKTK